MRVRKTKQIKTRVAKNIYEISNNIPTFRMEVVLAGKAYRKTFNTLEEAIVCRDAKRKELGLCRAIDNVPEGHKHCPTCDEIKACEEFYKSKRDKIYSRCKSCEKKYASTSEAKARKNEWQKERRKNDPLERLNMSLRERLNITLKKVSSGKMSKTAFYKEHHSSIIALFETPLAQEYCDGEDIHIDHIFPISKLQHPILGKYLESMGIEDTEKNRIGYVHSPVNVRFMWAVENMSKKDHLDEWLSIVGLSLAVYV